MKKNDVINLNITGMTAEGMGVGRYEGMAVFVPLTAPGDTVKVKTVKAAKRFAYGRAEEILTPSADRITPDCPVFAQCGGCCYRHISYDAELRIKTERVRDALERIGGFDSLPLKEIVRAPSRDGYRNKALLPLGKNKAGKLEMGFYAVNSHRIVNCESCRLQPEEFNTAMKVFREWNKTLGDPIYDELTHRGQMRRLYLRHGEKTGEMMACVVVNANGLHHEQELADMLQAALPELKSVVINSNREKTNVALGKKCRTVRGSETISDTLCGLNFRLSPLSFYQVNRTQAEKLYQKAAEYAALSGNETLLDLYCGAGTIGLSMASMVKKLIGVEIVPEAIENARQNAADNGIDNAEFICGDAAAAAQQLAERGEKPDVIVLDPPRKGCSLQMIEAAVSFRPERIVYVSCDPATLARDLKIFARLGYPPIEATPVDMFPATAHVETVVLLLRETYPQSIEVKIDVSDGEVTEQPTYKRIQEYVEKNYGFKVHTAYIAEVKRMCGLDMHKAPNAVEQRKRQYHPCPPEKVDAIKDALRHFGMI